MPERRRPIPEWAAKEREGDAKWIKENLFLLWPIAQNAYEQFGRGALAVDTTTRIGEHGHPFGYLTQEVIEQTEEDDTKLLVLEYEPTHELVISLVKPKGRISSYRIRIPQASNE